MNDANTVGPIHANASRNPREQGPAVIAGRVQSCGGRWRPPIARGLNIGLNASRNAVPDFDAIGRSMNHIVGASLFAAREYVESVGLMDERYFEALSGWFGGERGEDGPPKRFSYLGI